MVRRIIILFFGVLSLASSVRGQNTFNQRILVGEGAFQPASLYVSNDLLHVYSLKISNQKHHLCLSKYAYSGDVIDTLCINGDWGFSGVLPENDGQSYNGRHIQAGIQSFTPNLFGAFYQVYDESGDPDRFRAFSNPWWSGDSLDIFTQQIIPKDWIIDENGTIVLSYIGDKIVDSMPECGIICFNEDDDYQWHLEWINEQTEQIFAIVQLNNNFYIILERWNSELVVDNEIFIYKVNPEGVIVDDWYEPWNINVGNIKEAIVDGTQLIMVGSSQYDQEVPNAFISKLDSSMNVIWETTILNNQDSFNRVFEDITITIDGNYVVSGQYPYALEETDPINGDFMDDGWLAKFDSQSGDLLWQRFFRIVESTNKIHEIFDLKSTPDGGVAFCGESVDLTDDFGPGNPVQQGWLVKVDKYGCLVPGCQSNDIDEISGKEKAFSFGPNPLPKGQSLNLFNSRDFSSNAQYEILSTDGRLIASTSAGYADLTTFWSLPELSSGVYVLQLKEEGRIVQAEKLVVE